MSVPQSTPNFLMVTRKNKCHPLQVSPAALWKKLRFGFFFHLFFEYFLNPKALMIQYPNSHQKLFCAILNAFVVLPRQNQTVFFFFHSLEFKYTLLTIQSISLPSQPPVYLAKWNNALHIHQVPEVLAPYHQFCSPSLPLFPFEITFPKQWYGL